MMSSSKGRLKPGPYGLLLPFLVLLPFYYLLLCQTYCSMQVLLVNSNHIQINNLKYLRRGKEKTKQRCSEGTDCKRRTYLTSLSCITINRPDRLSYQVQVPCATLLPTISTKHFPTLRLHNNILHRHWEIVYTAENPHKGEKITRVFWKQDKPLDRKLKT